MEVTAGDVLVHIQRLLGEPAGAYYDMAFRLQQLNIAQVGMVQDALGSSTTVTVPVQGSDEIYLPDDFTTFASKRPYYKDSRGDVHRLRVESPSYADAYFDGWEDPTNTGTPRFLFVTGSRRVRLYPYPADAHGELVIPYTNAPDRMWGEDDLIFDGDPTLARYGNGLAYKVAAQEIMGINPDLGAQYLAIYNQELRDMREARRSSPQHSQRVRGPRFYRRRYSYG